MQLEKLDEARWGERGWDQVGFVVATNPGAAPGPIEQIASGGELARFMLALTVVLAGGQAAETLIFDEVDSGIGGATAAAVGERLERLAEHLQVLVITHSPQVAAMADQHWRVAKETVPQQRHHHRRRARQQGSGARRSPACWPAPPSPTRPAPPPTSCWPRRASTTVPSPRGGRLRRELRARPRLTMPGDAQRRP